MVKCEKIELDISLYLDGQLPENRREALEQHLEKCSDCCRLMEQYRRLDSLLDEEFSPVQPPEGLSNMIMASLPLEEYSGRKAAKRRSRRLHRSRWIPWAAAAAVLLICLLLPVQSWFPWQDMGDPFLRLQYTQPDPETKQPVPTIVFEPGPQVIADEDTDWDNTQSGDTQLTEDPPEAPNETVTPLPKVSYGSKVSVSYSLTVLASGQDYNALYPQVQGDQVIFYTDKDGQYLQWQVPLDTSSSPVCLGPVTQLPWEAAPEAEAALSPEEQTLPEGEAVPQDEASANPGIFAYSQAWVAGWDDQGLRLIDNAQPENIRLLGQYPIGSLLSWSPDGNKLMFAGADAGLYVYYIAEQLTLPVYDTGVNHACWTENSAGIVFSALNSATGYYAIYYLALP